jgi:hypothetical protein
LSETAFSLTPNAETLHALATAEAHEKRILNVFDPLFVEIDKLEVGASISWRMFLENQSLLGKKNAATSSKIFSLRSGQWEGVFIYGGGESCGRMTAHIMFNGSSIQGWGSDGHGNFSLSGEIDFVEQQSKFYKKYDGGHSVNYHAILFEDILSGRWNIADEDFGAFMLWHVASPETSASYLPHDGQAHDASNSRQQSSEAT